MIAFLNERSLEPYADWVESLTAFLLAAQELAKADTKLFRDSEFFQTPAFKQRFNTLGFTVEVRAPIRELVFGTRYYNCWRPSRQSVSTDAFRCTQPHLDFCDESVSEATERKLHDADVSIAVLSAPGSTFAPEAALDVTKVSSGGNASLPNIVAPKVARWIASQRGYYSAASPDAPRDFETVLGKTPDRFSSTGKFERRFGRKVFEEVATGRLYYVDEYHTGATAHLEVFSAEGEHLGTADLQTGQLDQASRREGRQLRL